MGRKYSGKKRGGQPGNLNRLKHGFYSERLKKITADEGEVMREDLNDEVRLLRAMLRVFVERWEDVDSLEMDVKVLDETSQVMVRIGSLLRTNFVLRGRASEADASTVIERVLLDLACNPE